MGILEMIRGWFGAQPSPSAPTFVDPTWLQLPCLAAGGIHQVVGEQSYQGALEAVCGGRHEEGVRRRRVTAVLEREPRNRYDRNAVRVLVAGRTVGHIPRQETQRYHAILAELASAGQPASSRAILKGGWDRGPADRGSIGIDLDLEMPLRSYTASDPFLPTETRVALTGEETCLSAVTALPGIFVSVLQAAANNSARPRSSGPFVLASHGGDLIGWLTPTMTGRYIPLLEEVSRASMPLTARGFVMPGAKARQVVLAMPAMPASLDAEPEGEGRPRHG
jgi:hypothetical protein